MPNHKTTVRVEKRGPVKRGTRTGVQGGVAGAVVALLGTFVNLSETQVGLAVVVLTALFSWVQTAVEDYVDHGFLREPPDVEPVN